MSTTTPGGLAAVGAPALVRGTPRRGRDAPTVAVCVPVYQGGRHLAATLHSVLAETAVDLELVVLDNASTDATAAVLAEVDDPRLVVWRNPVTVPMLENFDRVVALSHAPLVKILPADDLLEPGALRAQAAVLEWDPDIVLVAGRSHLVDEHDRMLAPDRFLRGLVGPAPRGRVVRRVVRHGANPIGGEVATLFRRAAFEACGGYRAGDGGKHADVGLWLRLLEHGGFVGLDRTVARFRIASDTCSASADRSDYEAQRRFTARIAADAGIVLRRRDRALSHVRASLARRRRELLFALNRLRATPDRGVPAVRSIRGAPLPPG